MTYDIKRNDVE